MALQRLTVVARCRRDLFSSMLPKYEKLLKEDLEILVYSGDVVRCGLQAQEVPQYCQQEILRLPSLMVMISLCRTELCP